MRAFLDKSTTESISCEAAADVRKHSWILECAGKWFSFQRRGLLYRADTYEGELKSSEEGQVYWISREEYEKKELAAGMPRVLQIMDDDNLTECFEELQPDGSFLEHLF